MTPPVNSPRWAMLVVAAIAALLLWWSAQVLAIPKIFLLARQGNPLLYYEGEILIGLAAALAWFRHWAAGKIVWLAERAYRAISAMAVAGVIGAEAFMHWFSIPHMEGWWMPILGSSAFATGLVSWVQKWRK